jgi:signal transduction histidine kinase
VRAASRRLSSLGRVFVALALLGGLWFATLKAVNDATDRGQAGRLADRTQLARIVSAPVAEWVSAAPREAAELAGVLGGARGQAARAAIDGYLARPRVFARSALVLGARNFVIAASGDRAALVDRPLTQCVVDGVPDPTFDEVLASSKGEISRIIVLPGTCDQGVAVAVPVPSGTLVAFGDLGNLLTRATQAAAQVSPLRLRVIDSGDGLVIPSPAEIGTVSHAVDHALGDRGHDTTGRFFSDDTKVVGAFHPVGARWGVLVNQPVDDFDVAPNHRPALKVARLLTGFFAVVFLLVAWFDVRRRRAARQADAHRSAFLAVVGHELRTPLTVIKGYTETLATRWDALSEESRHMLVSNMAPQAQRQARVIEHLLTAASLQAGTAVPPSIEPTDVGAVLEQVAQEFRPLAPLHTFLVHADPGLPLASADGRVVAQAVGELVDNAVRYSPSGGRVGLSAKASGRSVVVTVDDEGVGLPSDRSRLFQPFVQGEDVDRRLHDEGGIGVGLYIAKELVVRMRGTVTAEPRQPTGTRLTVTLPVARARRLTPA